MQRLCIQGFVLCKEFFVHKSYKLNFRIYLTFQQGFAFNFFVVSLWMGGAFTAALKIRKWLIKQLNCEKCVPQKALYTKGFPKSFSTTGIRFKIDALDEIHYLKTGKLIEACVESICILKKDLPKKHLKAFLNVWLNL